MPGDMVESVLVQTAVHPGVSLMPPGAAVMPYLESLTPVMILLSSPPPLAWPLCSPFQYETFASSETTARQFETNGHITLTDITSTRTNVCSIT